MTLPTGTITFLFTDIEGSTSLWERWPEAMKPALLRHDEILRTCVESHQGHIVKTLGDGVYAAFNTPSDAIVAALSIQRGLRDETWGATGPLRVRCALHTGAVEEREGDYFGSVVNRTARLLCGHGGQILLSQAAYDLVCDQAPPGATMRDLGEHRLRGLVRPERIYQLVVPDLRSDFPPLKTLDAVPNNLPVQLTSFIGREREILEVKELLQDARLLTLTGTGGCGKTRLSLQVGAEVVESGQFPDGVWFIEFAPLTDPVLVPQSLAMVFHLRDDQARPLSELVADFLREKILLIILDNCEHLIEACAKLADTLLRACPKLKILASSREALGIAGETTFRVPSLSLPDLKKFPAVDALGQYEAIRLFGELARAVHPGFAITNENAGAVAQICYRLDGIPLAIELAAARVKVLSVEQIRKHLDDRFKLLTGGSRTALPRQQTLRALIDWSHDLLSEPERALLRRLSVFAGGWTLEAAQSICIGEPVDPDELLDLLSRLIDKSLVLVEPHGEAARYRMMETIRQYARDRLLDTEEAARMRDRHLDYYMRFAQKAEARLHGPAETETMDQLDSERDNLRAALEWSLDEKRVARGMRLASALTWYWDVRGQRQEGQAHAESLLAQPEARQKNLLRANGLLVAAVMSWPLDDIKASRPYFQELVSIAREHGAAGKRFLALGLRYLGSKILSENPEMAESMLEEGLTVARGLGDEWLLVQLLTVQGELSLGKKNYAAARQAFEESLPLCHSSGDKRGTARVLRGLAGTNFFQNDYPTARQQYAQTLRLFQELEDRQNIATTLDMMAELERADGKLELARQYTAESVETRRELGPKRADISLNRLGYVALHDGELDSARSFFAGALATAREIGMKSMIVYSLAGFAAVMVVEKHARRAIPLFAFFESFFQFGERRSLTPVDQMVYERYLATAREQVDAESFDAAWAEGKAMTMEQALAYALEDVKAGDA